MQSSRYDRRRRKERITSQPRKPVQARGGSRDQRYRSSRNYRTIRGTDTGYNLRQRSINFKAGRGRSPHNGIVGISRPGVLIVGAVLIAALAIFGVSRCAASCSANTERKEVNEQDARVAAGVSSDLTTRLGHALDQADQLAAIAERADQLDTRLVDLALREPSAIAFVASYDPQGDHTGLTYDSKVSKGSFMTLYCWDRRWGAVDFAGGPMAITGSGPLALFIARTGLVGNAEISPADMASRVMAADKADTELGMSPEALDDSALANALNITLAHHDVTAERMSEVLDAGTVILLQAKESTLLGDQAHWLLATTENADGTVMVCDPTSPSVSERPWATSTLANASESMYAVTAASSQSTSEAGE